MKPCGFQIRRAFNINGATFCKTIEMREILCYNALMNAVRVKAYAKLNLTLAVNGKSGDYHSIDSLVCTVDVFDIIKISKRKDKLVSVYMQGMGSESIPFESNNAVKAAERYISEFSTCGVDIHVLKNIPMGAGMGGSSADAAGVIRGMNKLFSLGSARELKEIADSLGSDTGYMLTGGYARISGRGELVRFIDCKTRLDFLLLLPREGVSTPQCYCLWDEMKCNLGSTGLALAALEKQDRKALGARLFNDLYPPASKLNADVSIAVEQLKKFAPLGVNMTGSGSGAYALFENAEFCRWAASRYKGGYLCMPVKTVVPRIK